MPELPEITVYTEALERRILGARLLGTRILSPFALRTYEPPIEEAANRRVLGIERIGKRIAVGLEGELWLVIHLMLAGRLHWRSIGSKLGGKQNLAAFTFDQGLLLLTEAGSKRRASLMLIQGTANLRDLDPGGVEVLTGSEVDFREALLRENHTLKRALTNPRLFSGIGNSFSDEILHHARLSPLSLTQKLSNEQIRALFDATRDVLNLWIERLRADAGEGFPEKVTAFRPEMAVHGRFEKPCPVCSTRIQRIRYAENETNYCPRCQTEGRILADRSLSRLLKNDWPSHIDEL
jgi:formamidopyrimidine-DNA glycosylase